MTNGENIKSFSVLQTSRAHYRRLKIWQITERTKMKTAAAVIAG